MDREGFLDSSFEQCLKTLPGEEIQRAARALFEACESKHVPCVVGFFHHCGITPTLTSGLNHDFAERIAAKLQPEVTP